MDCQLNIIKHSLPSYICLICVCYAGACNMVGNTVNH